MADDDKKKWLPNPELLTLLKQVYEQLPFPDSVLAIGKPEAMGDAHERGQVGPCGENCVFPTKNGGHGWLLHFRANDQDPSQRPSDAMELIGYLPEHVKQMQDKWDKDKKDKEEGERSKKKQKRKASAQSPQAES